SYSADEIELKNKSAEDLSRTIGDAMRNGQPLTLVADTINGGGRTRENKLIRGHAYSIIGLDADTSMVWIRNPWGSDEPTDANGKARDGNDDGTFELALSDLNKNFDHLDRSG